MGLGLVLRLVGVLRRLAGVGRGGRRLGHCLRVGLVELRLRRLVRRR